MCILAMIRVCLIICYSDDMRRSESTGKPGFPQTPNAEPSGHDSISRREFLIDLKRIAATIGGIMLGVGSTEQREAAAAEPAEIRSLIETVENGKHKKLEFPTTYKEPSLVQRKLLLSLTQFNQQNALIAGGDSGKPVYSNSRNESRDVYTPLRADASERIEEQRQQLWKALQDALPKLEGRSYTFDALISAVANELPSALAQTGIMTKILPGLILDFRNHKDSVVFPVIVCHPIKTLNTHAVTRWNRTFAYQRLEVGDILSFDGTPIYGGKTIESQQQTYYQNVIQYTTNFKVDPIPEKAIPLGKIAMSLGSETAFSKLPSSIAPFERAITVTFMRALYQYAMLHKQPETQLRADIKNMKSTKQVI